MMKVLILDYETRSELDLKKVGGYEYSKHQSTQILCVGWRYAPVTALRHSPIMIWSPFLPGSPPAELLHALTDPTVLCVAHNAFFEQVITRNTLPDLIPEVDLSAIPSRRWMCTASLAAAHALPRNLENACAVLGLKAQKDMEGRRLILKYCKPRKPTKNNPERWHASVKDLKRIMQYCATDIDAETELFLSLPRLNLKEREVWCLDQKINWRGFRVDRDLVTKTLDMIDAETQYLHAETGILTEGTIESTNRRAAVLDWIEDAGYPLPDLRAKTVSDALAAGKIQGPAARLLEIRQAVSKTSTAKYEAFDLRSRTDSRLRDILLYWGASTGRWTGLGVQPQNFPQGKIKDTETACEILRTGDLELVRLIYGNPMEVFSSCLRGMITASPGMELFCADYAAIEVRVLFWIANHEKGLRAFHENRDLYVEMASEIYGRPTSEIIKAEREVAKRAVLGCGYGMGKAKFGETCKTFGQAVSEGLAEHAVNTYRSVHSPIVKLWGNIHRVSVKATLNKGKRFKINHTIWFVEGRFLYCELPSGRRLAYMDPEVRYESTPWGEKRPVLYHGAVNSLTRKWETTGTYGGRLVENIIQATARDFMADAMLRIDKEGYDIVLSVHDELVAERQTGKGSINEFEKLMAEVPSWGEGCPIRVEGWIGHRYRK